ncbi:alpha/beta hydrolase [Chachezhania antarctica]|uniref:alpha/beta hydrolase n=1 Tax=Chachezhania antarctica TaxID=2340860 RepID=UPI000EACAE13|nr:alpha/beta hydrolase [Chachezhania antarctica]|tara:strand:+ start:2103 stop:3041 length:939 start_codon:yes stop_codon:yes gene_type:complete
MKYDSLIDAETWAYIREVGSLYPEDAVERDIAGQREIYDRMAAHFHQGYPEGVETEDLTVDGVTMRVYTAGAPVGTVLFFHGGGFVVGGLESHDDVCAEFCAQTGNRVISVDYRLAPEHKHPAAYDDAMAALTWACKTFPDDDIVLVGDSAGGNLAAAVAHGTRCKGFRIVGQVLIYPGLGGDRSLPSYTDHAQAPMLTRDEVQFYENIRLSDGQDVRGDPSYAPLWDTNYKSLPPTAIFTADCDPLRDDALQYRDRLRAAGVPVYWKNEDGLVHSFLRARNMSARAHAAFERIVLAIEALGQGIWPYDEDE